MLSRRTLLATLGAGLASGCASTGPGAPGTRSETPGLTGAEPPHDRVVARGAALALGVEVEALMSASTQGGPRSASTRMKALIGPVRGIDIPRARARHPGALLVSLSNDGRAQAPGVALLGVSAQENVARILEYAGRRGVRRVAVLADRSEWSRVCAHAVERFAPRLDLTVTAVRRVDPVAAHEADIEAVHGADAVLIPPGGDSLRRLAAPLADRGVQLLGTHQWSGSAAPLGGWRAGLDPTQWRQVAARHEARFGASASHLSLLAHDAALVARAADGGLDPSALGPVEGATGVLRFDRPGPAWRGLAVLAVEADGESVVEPRAHA